jgi:hypothetical protein
MRMWCWPATCAVVTVITKFVAVPVAAPTWVRP